MFIEIDDDIIVGSHLRDDPNLFRLVRDLPEGEVIKLRVDGIAGDWQGVTVYDGGNACPSIKPVGAMATVWNRMQARRGERVFIGKPDDHADPVFARTGGFFEEWLSAEDEVAFGDLQSKP